MMVSAAASPTCCSAMRVPAAPWPRGSPAVLEPQRDTSQFTCTKKQRPTPKCPTPQSLCSSCHLYLSHMDPCRSCTIASDAQAPIRWLYNLYWKHTWVRSGRWPEMWWENCLDLNEFYKRLRCSWVGRFVQCIHVYKAVMAPQCTFTLDSIQDEVYKGKGPRGGGTTAQKEQKVKVCLTWCSLCHQSAVCPPA